MSYSIKERLDEISSKLGDKINSKIDDTASLDFLIVKQVVINHAKTDINDLDTFLNNIIDFCLCLTDPTK